jgi:hypothetical protein
MVNGKCTYCGCTAAFLGRFPSSCDGPVNSTEKKFTQKSNSPRCPRCKNTAITANKKGFGLGKAAIGGVALGGFGLLAGFFGSRKVYVSCLNCGHNWTPARVSLKKKR